MILFLNKYKVSKAENSLGKMVFDFDSNHFTSSYLKLPQNYATVDGTESIWDQHHRSFRLKKFQKYRLFGYDHS